MMGTCHKKYGMHPSFLQIVAIWFGLGIKKIAFFTIRKILKYFLNIHHKLPITLTFSQAISIIY